LPSRKYHGYIKLRRTNEPGINVWEVYDQDAAMCTQYDARKFTRPAVEKRHGYDKLKKHKDNPDEYEEEVQP
jgi:hypothetical protein